MRTKNAKYEQIEEEMLKRKPANRRKKNKMKVSGKSVFKLQELIKKKGDREGRFEKDKKI